MNERVIYRPGADFCDVMPHPEGWATVFAQGRDLVCEINFVERWRQSAGNGLLFTRGAVLPDGSVFAIGPERDPGGGAAILVSQGIAEWHGPTYGVQPVALSVEGGLLVVSIVRDRDTYIQIKNTMSVSLPHPVPGSTQGILDTVDGRILWTDLSRTWTGAGMRIAYPNIRGSVLVGQWGDSRIPGQPPDQIAGVGPQGAFTALLGEGYEPHLAQRGDEYLICARTPRGAAFLLVPPFPVLVAGSPVDAPPTPQPKPDPDPRPIPKPKPAPRPEPQPAPREEPEMGIASEEKFNEYIDAAGQIVVDFMQQQGKPYPLAEARQGAREMGDRYRKHGMNPTVGDLVWGVYLRMGTKPLDAARALDPIVDRIVEAQERLRR